MTCSKRQHSCWALHCRASGRSRGTARARRSRTDLTRRRERGRAPQNLPSRSRSSITSAELVEAGKGAGALSSRFPRIGIGTTRSDGRRRRAAASTARSCTLPLCVTITRRTPSGVDLFLLSFQLANRALSRALRSQSDRTHRGGEAAAVEDIISCAQGAQLVLYLVYSRMAVRRL